MSFIKIQSMQFNGLDPCPVLVEAIKVRGGRSLSLSGFAQGWLKESRDKIIAVASSCAHWGPMDKVLIHLLPVHEIKRSAHLELPMLLSCLSVLNREKLSPESLQFLETHIFSAAVSLEGELVDTELSDVLIKMNFSDKKVIGARNFKNLRDLWEFVLGVPSTGEVPELCGSSKDLSKKTTGVEEFVITGRYWERMSLLVSAVAQLPVFMIGAPGVGKSYLAQWASGIYEESSDQLRQEAELIWSLSESFQKNLVPIICPHAKSHISEFVGTRRNEVDRPGYFSLAHSGVLVLDEFSEMNRDCREILRNILDQKFLRRNTKTSQITWPANFWLIVTSNPCPCGMASGQDLSRCRCSESRRMAYRSRLSGPILDRMGIKMVVSAYDSSEPLRKRFAVLDSPRNKLREKVKKSREKMPQFETEAEQVMRSFFVEKKFNQRNIKNKMKIYCAYRAVLEESVEESVKWTKLQALSEETLFPNESFR